MWTPPHPVRTAGHNNNFGLLRLLLATLVVVSHSPALVDGDSSRDPLRLVFGTLTLGDVAVDGFFIISGYLVCKSFRESESVAHFAANRIARIFPGYLVSFLFCLVIVAPLGGGSELIPSLQTSWTAASAVVQLLPPYSPNVFPGRPFPVLNGSMWTIHYEALCYLLTPTLGLIGVLRGVGRYLLLGSTVLLLAANGVGAFQAVSPGGLLGMLVVGSFESAVRFISIFGVGALFYLFRTSVSLTGVGAAVSAGALLALLWFDGLAEGAVAVFGGYLLLWAGLSPALLSPDSPAVRNDISYGLYLYAFPIAKLVTFHWPSAGPFWVFVTTYPLACVLGSLSWRFVEQPVSSRTRRWLRVRGQAPASAQPVGSTSL